MKFFTSQHFSRKSAGVEFTVWGRKCRVGMWNKFPPLKPFNCRSVESPSNGICYQSDILWLSIAVKLKKEY